jgi:hypothetical protein
MMRSLAAGAALVLFAGAASGLDNGVGIKPAMGFNVSHPITGMSASACRPNHTLRPLCG